MLENFQFIGFNEGDWICKNSMAFVKKIEFWVFFAGNSIQLQKNGFGKKKWVTNSHLGQWHRLHQYIWVYSLSSMVIVEEVMAKLLRKSKYENQDRLKKGNGTLGLKSNLFQCY